MISLCNQGKGSIMTQLVLNQGGGSDMTRLCVLSPRGDFGIMYHKSISQPETWYRSRFNTT